MVYSWNEGILSLVLCPNSNNVTCHHLNTYCIWGKKTTIIKTHNLSDVLRFDTEPPHKFCGIISFTCRVCPLSLFSSSFKSSISRARGKIEATDKLNCFNIITPYFITDTFIAIGASFRILLQRKIWDLIIVFFIPNNKKGKTTECWLGNEEGIFSKFCL